MQDALLITSLLATTSLLFGSANARLIAASACRIIGPGTRRVRPLPSKR